MDLSHTTFRRLAMLVLGFLATGALFRGGSEWLFRPPARVCLLPAEFEPQDALLLAWPARIEPRHQQVLVDTIAACIDSITVVLIVPNDFYRQQAEEQLVQAGVPSGRVHFVQMAVDQMWVRDFGPLCVKNLLAFPEHPATLYLDPDPDMTNSLVSTAELAQRLGLETLAIPIQLDGGNILSNGCGLILTTQAPLQTNHSQGIDKGTVDQALRTYFGAEQVVYLEPLQGEASGHVDMFATFVAPNIVVMGQCHDPLDPVNQAILERNAAALEGLPTPAGPLQVRRIPMPPRDPNPEYPGQLWYTFTNVVFANGKLLVPTYEGVSDPWEQEALELYRELLPGWEIVPIDATALIHSEGALHCATLNVFRLPRTFESQADASTITPVTAVE